MSDYPIPPEVINAAAAVLRTRSGGHFEAVRDQADEKFAADAEAAIRAADEARRPSNEPLGVLCPKPLCHAKPGEPCYKKTGRPMHGFHEERIARAAVNAGTFGIAYCPEHGLHGGREECWVCRRPVEQIPMRPVSDWRPVEIPND